MVLLSEPRKHVDMITRLKGPPAVTALMELDRTMSDVELLHRLGPGS
jgi:hypothetical protein